MKDYSKFQKELEYLINKHNMENGSNTPDFILTEYLVNCLKTFESTSNKRSKWFSRDKDEEEFFENILD